MSTFGVGTLADRTLVRPFSGVYSEHFLEELRNLDRDLENAERSQDRRYHFTTDVTIGLSLSDTASIVASTLRTGAQFGSFMTSAPLWRSINPLMVHPGRKYDEQEPQDKVEELFSEKN